MTQQVGHDYPLLVQLREDPYPLYSSLHQNAPVQWNPVLQAWTVVRYADAVRVLTDPRMHVSPDPVGPDALDGAPVVASMLFLDPPDHTRLRSLVQKAFTPRVVERLRPRIVAIVDELLQQVDRRGPRFDVIADVAYPLPVYVIAELLGIPPADREIFHNWSSALAAQLDPLTFREGRARAVAARDALHTYLRGIIADRRRARRQDLISDLVAVEERGDTLSERELVAMCTLLLIAGHETTVNLIGNGMLALLEHPDQLQQLRDTPQLTQSAVEELLRFDSPVQMRSRIAGETLEIGGKAIVAGSSVLALLGAANRDPIQFEQPDTLKLDRDPNPHIAFGRGIHFCLGAPLARLEGQIAISAVVQRWPRLQLAGAPLRLEQITLRGLRSLPALSG